MAALLLEDCSETSNHNFLMKVNKLIEPLQEKKQRYRSTICYGLIDEAVFVFFFCQVSNNFLSPFHTTLRFSKGYATEETFWPMSLRYKPYFDFQSKLAHFSQPQTFLESAQNALEPVLRNLNARFWVENECPMVLEAELPLHLPPNRPKFLKSLLEGVADDDNYLNAKLFEDVPCSFRIFFSACKFIQRQVFELTAQLSFFMAIFEVHDKFFRLLSHSVAGTEYIQCTSVFKSHVDG